MAAPLAAVFGSSGPRLTKNETAFFRDADPLGYIVFARNVETPDQLRALIGDFREAVGRAEAPVLVDQEGGRVQRLRPPHWRVAPAAGAIAALDRSDREAGEEAARLNARLIAAELASLGITVDCLPVLDVPSADGHEVIGDRAVGTDPEQAARLGRIVCEAMLAQGVLPVIKHIPGHGRATADTHHDLPVVDTPLKDLAATDFAPFRALNDQPWAMTAHVVYGAVDAERPATTSPVVISDVIRRDIGFDGLLVSDDLSMNALAGGIAERAGAALAAGCDVALHCNGDIDEMRAVAEASGTLSAGAASRVSAGEARRRRGAAAGGPFDADGARRRLDGLLGRAAA